MSDTHSTRSSFNAPSESALLRSNLLTSHDTRDDFLRSTATPSTPPTDDLQPDTGSGAPKLQNGSPHHRIPGSFQPAPDRHDAWRSRVASAGSMRSSQAENVPRLPSRHQRRFVLAVDFGTTRTGVAFSTGPIARITDITMIQNWGGTMDNEVKVKSAISYIDSEEGETQWGSDIDNDRVAMINMKLELEPSRTRHEELDLTLQLLHRLRFLDLNEVIKNKVNPGFSAKPPEDIVTDLLARVFACAHSHVNAFRLKETRTPLDLIMTVPVDWSPNAQNSLYRAFRGAGFNKEHFPTLRDMIVVSEPVAAVQSTMRELLTTQALTIQAKDCFILVDAGGGTVDLVSFQVKGSAPNWEFELVTDGRGGPVGSAIIDTEFKRWLRKKVLPEDSYKKLDPANTYPEQMISPNGAETGPMRALIRRFEDRKIVFGREGEDKKDITIDLPPPLEAENVDDFVKDGLLTIERSQMRKFMDFCVNEVLQLVSQEVTAIHEKAGCRPRELLLVGGFGGSPYLQERLRRAFKGHRETRKLPISIRMPTPILQTTAVARGAVLYGLERDAHKDAVRLLAVNKSYGVVIHDDFQWLILEDDSVSHSRTREVKSEKWTPNISNTEHVEFRIYSYKKRSKDDQPPRKWSESRQEVNMELALEFDQAPDAVHRRQGPLKWNWRVLESHELLAELVYDDGPTESVLGSCRCKIQVEDSFKPLKLYDDSSGSEAADYDSLPSDDEH